MLFLFPFSPFLFRKIPTMCSTNFLIFTLWWNIDLRRNTLKLCLLFLCKGDKISLKNWYCFRIQLSKQILNIILSTENPHTFTVLGEMPFWFQDNKYCCIFSQIIFIFACWDDHMIKVKSESDFSVDLLCFPFLLVNLSVKLSWLFKNYYSHVEIFNQKTLPTVWFSWHFNANLEITEKLLNLEYFRKNTTNIRLF